MYDREDVALVYVASFAARTDAYSVWSRDHWTAVRERLTPGVAIAGLTSDREPVASYMLGPADQSHSIAVDFDTEDGWTQGKHLARIMSDNGAPTYVEPSRRGAHVWCVIDQQLPGIVCRRALRGFLQAAGIAESPKIELRPGQDKMPEGGLGTALRLPTMPHPATGKRYPFCYPDGEPVGKSLSEILLAIDYAPGGAILDASERYVPPFNPKLTDRSDRPPRRPYPDDDASASAILMDLWGVPRAAPGRAIRCPAHDDVHPSLSILADDRRVVCHSPACELHNNGRGRGTHELTTLAKARVGRVV